MQRNALHCAARACDGCTTCSKTERTIYQQNGFETREEYLRNLADEYEVDFATVSELSFLLGEDEDFDGLVSSLEDYNDCNF
jgi:hypothetical protein